MISSTINIMLLLTINLFLTSEAFPTLLNPPDICNILKTNFPDAKIPDCSTIDPDLLINIASNLGNMGFPAFKDPSTFQNIDVTTNQLPKEVQVTDDSWLQQTTIPSLLESKRPFMPAHHSVKHKPEYHTQQPPKHVTDRFQHKNVREASAEVELVRRHEDSRDNQEKPKNVTLSFADKHKQFILRGLPKNVIYNLQKTDFDPNYLSESLFYEGAIEKLYELQLAQFFS
uniref:Uncharacterized protein n=1 Tax=Arion vulgaris TaxID=1028688 RepID=A0A0B6ZH78_9EUPU